MSESEHEKIARAGGNARLREVLTRTWGDERYVDLVMYLEAENERLRDEVARRDAVFDWIAENVPSALELCPYKLVARPDRTTR